MAKIKKRKLSWTESGSSQVIGYKLYWSQGEKVNYDSTCAMLGNVTEIILPDDVKTFNPNSGPLEFGITAVDELGNESDMVTLSAPYQFNVPEAPENFYLQNLDDDLTASEKGNGSDKEESIEMVNPVEMNNHFRSQPGGEDHEISANIQMMSDNF